MAYFLPFRTLVALCLRVFSRSPNPARFIEPNLSSLTLRRHLNVSSLCLRYLSILPRLCSLALQHLPDPGTLFITAFTAS
jgi:hypothetical protein